MIQGRVFIIALCGAADRPDEEEAGPSADATPLEAAATPNLDALAARGATGSLTIVDPVIAPESDSGAMALLGYDPLRHYTGRGPLEALGCDFPRLEGFGNAVSFRMNVASHDPAAGRLNRRTARDLTDEELDALLAEVRDRVSLDDHRARFALLGYGRHRGVVAFTAEGAPLSGEVSNTDPGYGRQGAFGISFADHAMAPARCVPLDDSPAAARTAVMVEAFVARSSAVLAASPVNSKRSAADRPPANVLLLRDGGDRLPELRPFADTFARTLAIFGQVPAERGLARLLGASWTDCRQPAGQPGKDYYAKLAAIVLGTSADVAYIHVKAADEAAHDGDFAGKVAAIEELDELLIGPLAGGLADADVCVVTGDHATPWRLGVHSADPVPLVVAGGAVSPDPVGRFSERDVRSGSLGSRRACEILPELLGRRS